MKPYGLPRSADLIYPDVQSVRATARASHVGKLREKCGVFKSYIRDPNRRRQIRRYWKRLARRANKQLAMLGED